MSQNPGTILDEKYEIKQLIGEGGMGAVYEATHKLIGRRLAIKFLHPQYATNAEVVTRFQREAQAAAQIGHDNIIEVTDMGTASDGSPYIVMEFLEGCDVKKLIEDNGALDPKRVCHIMIQALAALQAAHDVGIIHRDLKPENIFLINKGDNPDYVKLLDFGISKFNALDNDTAKGLTQTGTVLGTPHYMSPEQARGDQNLTLRSDIYAMGIILYEMLTGYKPFDAPNYNALLIKILTEDPPSPEVLNPGLPEELVATIKLSMDRDANNRYQTCIEFMDRLVPFAPGTGTGTASQMSTASKTAIRRALYDTKTPFEMSQSGIEKKKSKLPIIIGGIAAATIAAVLLIVFFVFYGDNPQDQTMSPASSDNNPVTVVDISPAKEDTKVQTADAKKDEISNEIKVTISAMPKSSIISIDGATVANPYAGSFIKSKANRSIVIAAEGYKIHSEMIVFSDDLTLVYELDKSPEFKKSTKKYNRKKTKSTTVSDQNKLEDKPKDKPKSKPKGKAKSTNGKKQIRKIDYDDPWKS